MCAWAALPSASAASVPDRISFGNRMIGPRKALRIDYCDSLSIASLASIHRGFDLDGLRPSNSQQSNLVSNRAKAGEQEASMMRELRAGLLAGASGRDWKLPTHRLLLDERPHPQVNSPLGGGGNANRVAAAGFD